MLLAETVTFGGSGLDRAAHLRGDTARMGLLRGRASARCTLIWRGKPLFADPSKAGLHWLPMNHPLLADLGDSLIFLGLDEGDAPLFAADLSHWQPEEGAPLQAGFLDTSEQFHPDLPGGPVFGDLRASMNMLETRQAELAVMIRALVLWHRSHRFCAACGQESAMAMSGWQRNCPACRTSHFPRTDPVVIMLVTRGNSVLIGRSPGWPPGMFSLLAGFVEPGETLEAAVRREVMEETGVKVGPVRYLASQPWPFPASLMMGCHGEALSDEIEIDPAEIEEARWLTREELADVFAGTHPEIKAPRRGAIAQFLMHNWLADRLD